MCDCAGKGVCLCAGVICVCAREVSVRVRASVDGGLCGGYLG